MAEDPKEKEAKGLIASGKLSFYAKNYSRAIEKLQSAAKLTSGNREIWFFIGEANRMMGKDNEAVTAFSKANEISEDGKTYFKLGYVTQDRLKKNSEALEMYTKALELDPNIKDAWLNKGLIYDNLKNFDKAMMCNEECIKIDPNYAKPYNNIGWLYESLKNDKEKAITYYEKAIEVDPKFELARNNLARHKKSKKETAEDWNYEADVYFKKKNYKAALKHFKKATELKPGERLYWHNAGGAYRRLGKYKDAIKYYQKANEIYPDFVTYIDMGLSYKNLKKYDKAFECYEKADEKRPGNYIVNNNFGDIAFKKGNFPLALKFFKRTVETNPRYALGWYNVGITYKRLGEYYKAMENWAKALAIDPNHRLTKKAFGTLLRERPYLKDDIIAVAEGKFDKYLK